MDDYIDILSHKAKQHILYGDNPRSGGHLWPGQAGKAVFPHEWSANKIVHEVGDIVTDPKTKWYAQTGTGGPFTKSGKPARWATWESRDGIRTRIVYEAATGEVITAFPDPHTPVSGKPIP
jgi:filamentous hemagglutinin